MIFAKRHIAILLLFFSSVVFAQHCGWDGVTMFAVKVTDSLNKPIDGLKLTLLDSLGNPVVIKPAENWRFKEYQKSDTLIFNQNLKEIDLKSENYKTRPLKLVGKNYFVIFTDILPADRKAYYYIKIEDPSKTYYTQVEVIFTDALIDLCEDAQNQFLEYMLTFKLVKRPELLFSHLQVIKVIKDKKIVEKLEEQSEYKINDDFFIAPYVDKTNTNIFALFQKKASGCVVYMVSGFEFLHDLSESNSYLTFIDGYNSGGAGHSESEGYFTIVDLKKKTILKLKCLSYSETWNPHGDDASYGETSKCESEIDFKGSLLTVKKSYNETYEPNFEGDCIDSGTYKIVNEKLVKLSVKN